MINFIRSFTAFIIALSLLITVHELGHFWIARLCGVLVEHFSIGLGNKLWSWRDKHGTEYSIAAIPFGGYVKLLDESTKKDNTDYSSNCSMLNYTYKPIWQRVAIVSAGPLFNFLFSIFVYWLVFLIGVPSYRPIINDITPNSIAAQAGLYPGVEIKSVNGIKTPNWNSARLQLIAKLGDNEVAVSFSQLGSSKSESTTLNLNQWKFNPRKQDIICALGIIPLDSHLKFLSIKVQQNSAAMKAGLQTGDNIIMAYDQPITSWQSFINKIHDYPNKEIKITIDRHGDILNITLYSNTQSVGSKELKDFMGITPVVASTPMEYKTIRRYGPIAALGQAVKETWQIMQLTIRMLLKLIVGNIKINSISGPISIAQGARISAEQGLVCYLTFLALISTNLGIINLLPLPVLDGGYLLLLLIEKINKKPISKRIQDISYRIGFTLLIIIMIIALFNDFYEL